MNSYSNKRQYAQAVLSGAMSKTCAFTTYINDNHRNPSQGAYKLERTQVMRDIMTNVQEELRLTQSVKTKQLQIAEQALIELQNLLAHSDGARKLAVLRLAKSIPQVTNSVEFNVIAPVAGTDSRSNTIPKLSKSLAVLENH